MNADEHVKAGPVLALEGRRMVARGGGSLRAQPLETSTQYPKRTATDCLDSLGDQGFARKASRTPGYHPPPFQG